MLDVDNFKSFNDTYGHAEGDRCLCIVAGVMMDCLRMENDVVARFGGEEFIAVLPDCPLEEGTLIAERIRRALAAAAVPHVRQGVSHVVTASLGVAQGRMGDMIGLHEAVSRADAALYEAKKAGRNRVEPQPSRRGQIRLVDPAEAQTIGRTA
jgi:diguanylate cyclase (GGDEF)-like protein